jgi:hypothetical protein
MTKPSIALVLILFSVVGCARVAVEGGDKPIHIVLDVNVRVARELDNFFDFEDKHAATTNPVSQPVVGATTQSHSN